MPESATVHGLEMDAVRESVRAQLARQLGQAPPPELVEHVLRSYIGQLVSREQTQHLSLEQVHNYWRNPEDAGNAPADYLQAAADRSLFLLRLINNLALPEPSILEIGCNAGRNLDYLWQAGYHRLQGIDLNGAALELLRATFPAMAAAIKLEAGPVEELIKAIPDRSVDIVFTMAVLVHVHYASDWVLAEIARITRTNLLTLEDEEGRTSRHFPRNYGSVFAGLGMRQVACLPMDGIEDLSHYTARVFSWY